MRYTIRNILYATDLGPHGPDVFRHAAGLAERFDAQIHIIHVVEPLRALKEPVLQRYVSESVLEMLRNRNVAAALSELEKRLERFCHDLLAYQECQARVAGTRVLEGAPAQVILEQAERLDVECIVLGSRRYSPLGEIVIGSVARKVTMKSRRPIFLVPI